MFLAHARQSRPMAPAGLFVSQRTGSHSAGISCTTHELFLSVGGSVRYMVQNLRCTVTIDSVLANSKTHTAFLFNVHAIFRHDYPLVVEPASTPRILVPIDMHLSALSFLVVTQSSSEVPEGLMNNPV